MKNLVLMTVLIRFNDDIWWWLTFFGSPCMYEYKNQWTIHTGSLRYRVKRVCFDSYLCVWSLFIGHRSCSWNGQSSMRWTPAELELHWFYVYSIYPHDKKFPVTITHSFSIIAIPIKRTESDKRHICYYYWIRGMSERELYGEGTCPEGNVRHSSGWWRRVTKHPCSCWHKVVAVNAKSFSWCDTIFEVIKKSHSCRLISLKNKTLRLTLPD